MSRSSRYSSVYKNKSQAKRGSSRLIKKQEKEMRKQTVFFIFLAIVLLVVFIFVIVPNLIRLFFNFFGDEQANIIEDDVPPTAPLLLAAPPEAIFSSQILLKGYADPNAKVVFVLNGEQVEEKEVNDEGEFSQEVQLDEGVNQLSIYAVNERGTESLQTKTYDIIYDNEPPQITVTEPKPDSVIELKRNRNTLVSGETEPHAKVYLNDRLIVVDEAGQFSTTYYLNEGENVLRFVAIDQAGNQGELEIKVKFLNN